MMPSGDGLRAILGRAIHFGGLDKVRGAVHNPGCDKAMNRRQAARLRQLSDLHANGRLFMFELLVPPKPAQLQPGTGNRVLGNLIGTDVSGTSALTNGYGIELFSGSAAPIIGGSDAGAGNVISGNLLDGVGIYSDGNLLQGNWIGTVPVRSWCGNCFSMWRTGKMPAWQCIIRKFEEGKQTV